MNYAESDDVVYERLQYVKVKDTISDVLEISVVDSHSLKYVQFINDVLYCTFHFTQV